MPWRELDRETIQQPRQAWIYVRKVLINSDHLPDVPDVAIRRWLDQVGPFVESLHSDFSFWTMDRISVFGPGFGKTQRLKIFRVISRAPYTLPPGSVGGDVLLSALAPAPMLETLELEGVPFSSPETVEGFLAGSKTLKILQLSDVSAISMTSSTTVDAVARGFCRGIKQNKSLTTIKLHHSNRSGPKGEAVFRETLLGIMQSKSIQKLNLGIPVSTKDHTSSALRNLLVGSTTIQELDVSVGASNALVAVFLGLADNVSVTEIRLRAAADVLLTDPAVDIPLASAIVDCFGSNKTLRTCVFSGSRTMGFGPRSVAAFTNSFALADTLENLTSTGEVVPSSKLLYHIGQLRSVRLVRLVNPDWTVLEDALDRQECTKLTTFDLSRTLLSNNDLEVLVRCFLYMDGLEKLCMFSCGITAEVSALFVRLIQRNTLKTLYLHNNPIGSQGAKVILEAVRNSKSLERLSLGGAYYDYQADAQTPLDINDCRAELQGVLVASRLVFLRLCSLPMERECVVSLGNGLRKNTTLKELIFHRIAMVDLSLLGEALVENCSLETLDLSTVTASDDDGKSAEDQSICRFMELLPQMKGLKKIEVWGLCLERASERVVESTVAAFRENTTLEQFFSIVPVSAVQIGYDNRCHGNTIQYYLELNRLRRHQYLSSIGEKTLSNDLLPFILARMTKPEFAGHLYYFLRHGAGLLESTSLKRKAVLSPEG